MEYGNCNWDVRHTHTYTHLFVMLSPWQAAALSIVSPCMSGIHICLVSLIAVHFPDPLRRDKKKCYFAVLFSSNVSGGFVFVYQLPVRAMGLRETSYCRSEVSFTCMSNYRKQLPVLMTSHRGEKKNKSNKTSLYYLCETAMRSNENKRETTV